MCVCVCVCVCQLVGRLHNIMEMDCYVEAVVCFMFVVVHIIDMYVD